MLGGIALLIAGPAACAQSAPPPSIEIKIENVTDKEEASEIVRALQGPRTGGQIIACDHVINLYHINQDGRDSSYGAFCTIDTGTQKLTFLMCNDRLVGKFTQVQTRAATQDEVGQFIEEHCPPGG